MGIKKPKRAFNTMFGYAMDDVWATAHGWLVLLKTIFPSLPGMTKPAQATSTSLHIRGIGLNQPNYEGTTIAFVETRGECE